MFFIEDFFADYKNPTTAEKKKRLEPHFRKPVFINKVVNCAEDSVVGFRRTLISFSNGYDVSVMLWDLSQNGGPLLYDLAVINEKIQSPTMVVVHPRDFKRNVAYEITKEKSHILPEQSRKTSTCDRWW